MEFASRSEALVSLVKFARRHLLLDERDEGYALSRLLAAVGGGFSPCEGKICDDPQDLIDGILAGTEGDLTVLGERLMDAVMLRPSEFERIFWGKYAQSPIAATNWANAYAIHSNYVKAAAIAKNLRWHADCGLEITVNLSKPEKNNADLKKQLAAPSLSYPKCTICRENEGFERAGFSRANLRTISLTLAGEPWFWQYSPYAYFNEHGIAVRCEHTPMVLDGRTAERLFDFVDLFPHYFIGNNAPLPRVGGSILMHDHFQGGAETLPMQKAPVRIPLRSERHPAVRAGVLDWYDTALRLEGTRGEVSALAYEIATAWETFSFPAAEILPATDEQHSTASFIARKRGEGYILDVILRNNRCSSVHPDGIFHAHRDKHHIKRESIGLIEAMGLFILPARLKRQLGCVCDVLEGKSEGLPADMGAFESMTERLLAAHGRCSPEEARLAVKADVEATCREILEDCAVFKRDSVGDAALEAFLNASNLKKE